MTPKPRPVRALDIGDRFTLHGLVEPVFSVLYYARGDRVICSMVGHTRYVKDFAEVPPAGLNGEVFPIVTLFFPNDYAIRTYGGSPAYLGPSVEIGTLSPGDEVHLSEKLHGTLIRVYENTTLVVSFHNGFSPADLPAQAKVQTAIAVYLKDHVLVRPVAQVRKRWGWHRLDPRHSGPAKVVGPENTNQENADWPTDFQGPAAIGEATEATGKAPGIQRPLRNQGYRPNPITGSGRACCRQMGTSQTRSPARHQTLTLENLTSTSDKRRPTPNNLAGMNPIITGRFQPDQ